LGKQSSILQDREFELSRETIVASRKELKKEGKGNKPNAWNLLKVKTLNAFGRVQQLVGEGDPETLQNSVWPKMWSNPLHPERCPV